MRTAIIVDDEIDARILLREYISITAKLDIIGEAGDGKSAIEIINRLKPEVVFMDIQMPIYDGFEVLSYLDYMPDIVFSTAYDHYAIKAFEVHAIDYLLKPYGRKRFEKTLGRIINNKPGIISLTEELLNKNLTTSKRILLHKGKNQKLISVNEIYYAEAFGDYTKVYTMDNDFLANRGISVLLEKLDIEIFYRIHRSRFVNIDHIHELKKIGRYYFVVLKNQTSHKVSQTYIANIKKHMI